MQAPEHRGVVRRIRDRIGAWRSARERYKRVETPTLLQMEAVECGAAALGIILRYYGKYIPLEALRLACGVSRDGSTAWNVLAAARGYGLQANGVRRSNLLGLQALTLPVIIFWKFNHFLVLEGFGPDRVYINDPATGPRSISYQEFDGGFTGVVLTFAPGPDFHKGGEKFNLLRVLRRRLVGSESGISYVLAASLLLMVVGLIVPAFLRIFVDDILIARQNWLSPLLLGMSLAVVLSLILTWLQQEFLLRLETKLALSSSSNFFWHIIRLPMEFFTQRYAGDIAFRLQINDRVARLLAGELATNAISLLLVVFYAALMLQYDVLLTVIGVAVVLLNLWALRAVSRRRIDANRSLLQERGKLVGTALNGVETIETLKATGSEPDFFARWAGYQAKVVTMEQRLGRYTGLLNVVPPLLTGITTAIILLVGGLRVLSGSMTIGMVVAFQSLMVSFTTPAVSLVNLGSRLQEAEGDLNRLEDVLHYPIDGAIVDNEAEIKQGATSKLEGTLDLNNVTFGYSRLEAPLIEDFSLHLKPGQRVALVGGSGSGKSTVARLVAGLYQPWSGEILFDGVPRGAIARRIINASIAMVDQNIIMFSGTIRDNLTLWDRTVPKDRMIEAAKDAEIHNTIAARPNSYNYLLNANGYNFSGGERQRMEIARALVSDPTLLILDEATSALDPLTEKNIVDNLRKRGCTCLIVAHRLSTIRDCDEIIVMEKGKIVQRGVHKQLIREGGPYADLVGAERDTSEPSLMNSLFDKLL